MMSSLLEVDVANWRDWSTSVLGLFHARLERGAGCGSRAYTPSVMTSVPGISSTWSVSWSWYLVASSVAISLPCRELRGGCRRTEGSLLTRSRTVVTQRNGRLGIPGELCCSVTTALYWRCQFNLGDLYAVWIHRRIRGPWDWRAPGGGTRSIVAFERGKGKEGEGGQQRARKVGAQQPKMMVVS
jgi:hypothetical protein